MHHRTIRATLAFSLLLHCSILNAGNSSGGGGAVVRDGDNPWFVQNTRNVTYCINRDPNHFHLDNPTIDRKIQAAVQYWRTEFSHALEPLVGGSRVEIATQEFQKVDCTQNPDLTFEMGILSEAQKESCDDPKKYIGLTIRSDYDTKSLRGRGYIYIAPDSGPLKPNAPELVDDPWSRHDGGLLYRVLVHELGHVFGLRHTSTPPPFSGTGMMNASYAEWILRKPSAEWFATNTDLPHYFAYVDRNNSSPESFQCKKRGLNKVLTHFLGIPEGWHCYAQAYAGDALKVYAQEQETSAATYVGSIQWSGRESFSTQSAVDLYLPPEQTVFPSVSNRMDGPKIKYTQRLGIYHSADGQISRECAVTMPLNEVAPKISGVMDGLYFMDLDQGT